LGNCQNTNLVACIQALTGDVNPASYEISLENVAKLAEEQLSALVVDHDFLFAQNSIADFIITQYPEASGKIVRVPHVTFNGYHPDLVYIGVRNCDEPLTGPTWHYHSSIALYSWLHGFNVSETLKLYTNETYERLGFFDYWKAAEQALLQEGDACGLPLDGLLAEWATRGCFMHSYNHPKLFATADVARALLQKIGLPTLSIAAEEYIVDMFQERGWVWPVYPEIGNRHRVKGNYVFRTPTFVCPPGKSVLTYGLKEYVEQSFAEYAKFSRGDLICSRLEWPQYRELQPPRLDIRPARRPPPMRKKGRSDPGRRGTDGKILIPTCPTINFGAGPSPMSAPWRSTRLSSPALLLTDRCGSPPREAASPSTFRRHCVGVVSTIMRRKCRRRASAIRRRRSAATAYFRRATAICTRRGS
jgi:hypothetical protein